MHPFLQVDLELDTGPVAQPQPGRFHPGRRIKTDQHLTDQQPADSWRFLGPPLTSLVTLETRKLE